MRPPRRAGAPALCLAAFLAAGPVRAAPVVEYLTIEANESSAAGGHAALRLGERVFHFEAADGRLRLAREPWPELRFRYRVLANRTLHAQRIDAGADAATALERHFDAQLWTGILERERLDALARDVRGLEALAAAARGEPATLPVPGAGFFERSPSSPPSAGSEAIRAVGRAIARARGEGFTARRLDEARAALRALRPDAKSAGAAAATFSQRMVEELAAVHALEVLRDAPPLRESALAALPEDVAPLSAHERKALAARRAALERELVRLVGSERPDWGGAFALGLARVAALAESLDAGRLIVLDALPEGARRIDAATVRRAEAPLREHLARSRAHLARARERAATGSFDEPDHARLEAAASRTAEIARALEGDAGLRLARGAIAPRGIAEVPLVGALPDAARSDLTAPLAAARERLRDAGDEVYARHGYDLHANNCVTAIFREVEAALAGDPDALTRHRAAASGPDALGPTLRALRFVPFVSAHVVARDWRVSQTRTLDSHRRVELAALRAREPAWRVALRESNTLTSTFYRANPDDSAFLFFTDASVWSRPLLGAANLATGVAYGATGVLRAPWDRGEQLLRGARGVVASLPELVFLNVRKGSFPFALPAAAPRWSEPAPNRRCPSGSWSRATASSRVGVASSAASTTTGSSSWRRDPGR